MGESLSDWLAKAIKPRKTASTYRVYKNILEVHLVQALGDIRLRALTSLDLEAYYAEKQANNLDQREYARLIKAAKARSIELHGLRHTLSPNTSP